jgi:lambda family phage portal protein
MAIFDFLKAKPKEQPKAFKRSYQAASTSRLFADYIDSERSPDSELYPVINKLRVRSRDLARNNAYLRRYLQLLQSNVIGKKGVSYQSKALDSVGNLDMVGNQAVEAAFKMWARKGHCTADGKMSFVDAQKLVMESLARDGEVFIIKHRSATFHDSFALEFIEPEQVDDQLNQRLSNGNEVRMGVELDKFRRPVAYHMLTYHKGDYDYVNKPTTKKHIRVPAEKVIHIYMPRRAGQTRGEPWASSVMGSIKMLDGWREASIVAARVGASKMGFFTSPAGDGFVADDLDGNIPIFDAEAGTFHQLPTGVDFKAFDPQYPTSEFDSFHKAVLKGIASGLGISYTALANDLEATSYSSIRQGALEERDFYQNIQEFIIEHFVRPVFESWLESAMEMGAFGIPLRAYSKFAEAAEFRGRAWNWVDPQKEMTAAITGLQAGILSLSDVAANYGKDSEELLSQIARDRALMEQFGISYGLEPYGVQKMPEVAEEGDEDDSRSEDELNRALIRALGGDFGS